MLVTCSLIITLKNQDQSTLLLYPNIQSDQTYLFLTPYSLVPTPYSLFPVLSSLFPTPYSPFPILSSSLFRIPTLYSPFTCLLFYTTTHSLFHIIPYSCPYSLLFALLLRLCARTLFPLHGLGNGNSSPRAAHPCSGATPASIGGSTAFLAGQIAEIWPFKDFGALFSPAMNRTFFIGSIDPSQHSKTTEHDRNEMGQRWNHIAHLPVNQPFVFSRFHLLTVRFRKIQDHNRFSRAINNKLEYFQFQTFLGLNLASYSITTKLFHHSTFAKPYFSLLCDLRTISAVFHALFPLGRWCRQKCKFHHSKHFPTIFYACTP